MGLTTLVKRTRYGSSQRLPPGSLGLPVIGHSLNLLWAMRANKAEKWITERAKKYGPVSKLSLFGNPTVFIYGQAANKFVFTDSTKLSNQQTDSVKRILGERCLLELRGEDHKRVRDALTSFLKPDSLKNYVGKMEEEIKVHLEMHWQGKDKVTVFPSMKSLTFNIICSLLFGLERGTRRDVFISYFEQMLGAPSHQDLITCLLSIRGEDGNESVSEDEIIHNVMLIMIAGHDTSSVLLTFIVQLLAKYPTVYAGVLKEQDEIRNSKPSEELLTWEDLAKMKYTWRVVMETLRTIPPIFGGFRKTLDDIEYDGYLIPRGWQILWVTGMTHMDAEIFQDPTKFVPARFENAASIPPYSYIPFGGGARICPGYEFAKLETLLTVHYIVTHFTWKLCCHDNRFRRDPLPVPTQQLPIQIVSRKKL